jgi:hypothetical protein
VAQNLRVEPRPRAELHQLVGSVVTVAVALHCPTSLRRAPGTMAS